MASPEQYRNHAQMIAGRGEPLLGLATTRQLLEELETRMEITSIIRDGAVGPPAVNDLRMACFRALNDLDAETLGYRTVDS